MEETAKKVDAGVINKYKILGEIFPLNEDGTVQETALEIDLIQELPESVGAGFVEQGLAEEVAE